MPDDQDMKPEPAEEKGPEAGGSSESSEPQAKAPAEEKPSESQPVTTADEPKAGKGKPKAGRKKKEGQLTKAQANLLLVGLTVYVVVLAVLAVDQIFGLGLVRPELDRLLIARIESLESEPPAVPVDRLAQLRQAALSYTDPHADPRLAAIGRQIHDEAYAFAIGSPPDQPALTALGESIEKFKTAQPPAQDPGAVEALASMAAALSDMVAAIPPEDAKALARRREATDYIINYHEFSIPHLIRALRKAEPPAQAAALYCLDQIARRFFRYAGPDMTTPEEWSQWWKRTEAGLENLSRR